jgi:hypothetical protein
LKAFQKLIFSSAHICEGLCARPPLLFSVTLKYACFEVKMRVRLRDAVMDGARLEIDNLSRTQRSAQN